ncbi:TetR/AcrR family transcriptional regulator [Nonomuraea sp. NPDC050451]|uniref:TetR/AcrR family transcriptional regulator n=1 Tax=Nonomuraea sp. NPDC050451 TaxID=3364364 RepID=UPI003793A199
MIVTAARELAESEGRDAVTTRRLSERVEYSRPVLYSHFKGKDAIVREVAIEGFTELTSKLRAARTAGGEPKEVLRAAFGEFVLALEPVAGEHHPGVFAEVVWAALHGQATLAHDRRIPAEHQGIRIDLLIDHLTRPA